MASSFSIALGNVLYKNCFPLYKIMYKVFKKKQDAFEISLLHKYIKPNDTVLDIGANIGFYSEIFSEIVGPKGTVHCFEPDKTNFKHLTNRVGDLKNVHIYNKAVSEKDETIKIYTSKLLNVDHRTYKPDDYDEEIDIDAVNLDLFLKDVPTINFIKIDIQGFEMSAMKGMLQILKNNDVKMLSEFWPYGLKKAGYDIVMYFNFLSQFGFKIYLIEDNKLNLLSEERVKTFMDLPEETYMNIFATKNSL